MEKEAELLPHTRHTELRSREIACLSVKRKNKTLRKKKKVMEHLHDLRVGKNFLDEINKTKQNPPPAPH